jgi:hypothetical protein
VRPHDALADECDAFVARFTLAPTFLERDKLQTDLMTLAAADELDFRAIAAVGKQLAGGMAEEEYRTLRDRHAALVDRFTAKCAALKQEEEFALLILLGIKLKELQALNFSALPLCSETAAAAPLPHAALSVEERTNDIERQCDALTTEFASVPSFRQAVRLRDATLRAVTATGGVYAVQDWEAIGRAGNALKAANTAVKDQPLSEEDYKTTLALVQKATSQCRELAAAGDYATLAAMAAKLADLTALDVSTLPQRPVG